jgi:hypothetical protein
MPYQNDAQIQAVVTDFETCQTGKDDFHHQQHIVVAIHYLQTLTFEEALEKLRESLMRFLNHHNIGNQQYNETLTVFWLEMVALELSKLPAEATLVDKCNSVTAAFSNPKLALNFYSEDLLWSERARDAFVPPDVKRWK